MTEHQKTFAHQGFTYQVKPSPDDLSISICCTDQSDGSLWWETTKQVLSHNALMLFWYWSAQDDEVSLVTIGEHYRGATLHEKKRHTLSPFGYVSAKDEPC